MNKPCPFCGGEAVIRYTKSDQFIECIRCGVVTDHFPTIEAAWTAWNTRPVEDAALEVCRALVATAIERALEEMK